MANMSYCRFENTYRDLTYCQEHLDDTDLSDSEKRYREYLITLCYEIANSYYPAQYEDDGNEEEN